MVHWLTGLAGLAIVGTYIRAIFFTPPELTQGLAQKIYYLHVPAAITMYLAFSIVAVSSIVYLWLRDDRLDRIAESLAEIGVVFGTIVLTTGPFWGRPVWGAWWVWSDMRLLLTLFLWFIYVAYLVLRTAVDEPGRRARYSAVLGILGALLIPFIHLSVYMFNNMHPMPIVLKPEKPSLPPEMLTTFLIAMGSYFVLFFAFLRVRYAIATARAAQAAEAA